jgi:TRAP-type uncharacterized transport system substrate-binding protein
MTKKPAYARPSPVRWTLIVAIIATIAVMTVALFFTERMPPRTVVMATGSEGTAYHVIGQHYARIFARHGVRLKVLATDGSVDNVNLLNDTDSGVNVALVQSGTTDENASPELASLGTLFYEPLWLFMRKSPTDPLRPLEPGMRISLGTAGSGTYKLARELIVSSGTDLGDMKLFELGENDAGEALMRGELDFVAMSMSPRSSIIQKLLKDPDIITLDWQRADAHVALMPYLSKRTLPRGVADLANDRPARDLNLIATKANLVVRADLHQAIQHLLLEAASEIHGGPGIFNKSGEFPAAEPIDLPLSDIARGYYRNGQPFLQRYLPFWLAALTSRLLVLLIPIVGVVYPLFRLVPAVYGWSMRRRIFRLYGELKFLEAQLATGNPDERTILIEQLDDLETRANRIRVPIAFSHMLYTLKHHISLVQQRVNAESDLANAAPTPSG